MKTRVFALQGVIQLPSDRRLPDLSGVSDEELSRDEISDTTAEGTGRTEDSFCTSRFLEDAGERPQVPLGDFGRPALRDDHCSV